jgi:hypothetical protein
VSVSEYKINRNQQAAAAAKLAYLLSCAAMNATKILLGFVGYFTI